MLNVLKIAQEFEYRFRTYRENATFRSNLRNLSRSTSLTYNCGIPRSGRPLFIYGMVPEAQTEYLAVGLIFRL